MIATRTNVRDDDTRLALGAIVRYVEAMERWVSVPADSFSSALSTNTITVSNPDAFTAGTPLKYRLDGVDRYGIVVAVSGRILSVSGAALVGATYFTSLWRGTPELVREVRLNVQGAYAAAPANSIQASIQKRRMLWRSAPAYLVAVRMYNAQEATGSDPTLNATIGGNRVLTTEITLGSGWTSGGTVSTTYYRAVWNDAIDVDVVTVPGGADAEDLSVEMTFVME